MMMSLFISFDPLMLFMNVFMLMFIVYYFNLNKNYELMLMDNLKKEFMLNSNSKFFWVMNFFSLTFIIILLLNIYSIFPYIFTITAHLSFCLLLSLSFWMSFFIMGLIYNTLNFISHLVPYGTPLMLTQFMVLIESVSQLIRPITLSIRLAANMTAGHILLILCSSSFFLLGAFSGPLIILMILETAVAFIQAYVFITLINMYMGEFN